MWAMMLFRRCFRATTYAPLLYEIRFIVSTRRGMLRRRGFAHSFSCRGGDRDTAELARCVSPLCVSMFRMFWDLMGLYVSSRYK